MSLTYGKGSLEFANDFLQEISSNERQEDIEFDFTDKSLDEMGEFKFENGKNTGRTFKELLVSKKRDDKQYCQWAYKQRDNVAKGSLRFFVLYLEKIILNKEN